MFPKKKRGVRKFIDWIQIRCKLCYCNLSRTASVSATAAVRTIVEEEVNSSASEEETYEANEIVENSVCSPCDLNLYLVNYLVSVPVVLLANRFVPLNLGTRRKCTRERSQKRCN